jgi:formylglycine-generating enzyme required for sulfatase activity
MNKITILKDNYKTISSNHEKAFKIRQKNIEKDYYIRLNIFKKKFLINPAEPKGMFETTIQYTKRMALYNQEVIRKKKILRKKTKELENEFNLRFEIAKAEVDYLNSLIKETEPIINTLKKYQEMYYTDPGNGHSELTWFPPEADLHRFPIHIQSKEKKAENYIHYKSQKKAEKIWKYRYSFVAEKLFQYTELPSGETSLKHTGYRIKSSRIPDIFFIKTDSTKIFSEIIKSREITEKSLPAAKLMVALKNKIHGPVAGMDFIYISPRRFIMGSPRTEEGRWADETQHEVILTKGFYMQTTEVTQGQWRAVMGNNPSIYQKCGSECPVENVYWGDVQEYIDRLNVIDKTATYRLPTESEWEYACRAGSTETGAYGNNTKLLDYYGWYRQNSNGGPQKVSQKRPNYWNLYDMHGNVSEWCSDWYGNYPVKPVEDPQGAFTGKFRVARGGSWFHNERRCRSADRNADLPGDRSGYIGFRLVMEKK